MMNEHQHFAGRLGGSVGTGRIGSCAVALSILCAMGTWAAIGAMAGCSEAGAPSASAWEVTTKPAGDRRRWVQSNTWAFFGWAAHLRLRDRFSHPVEHIAGHLHVSDPETGQSLLDPMLIWTSAAPMTLTTARVHGGPIDGSGRRVTGTAPLMLTIGDTGEIRVPDHGRIRVHGNLQIVTDPGDRQQAQLSINLQEGVWVRHTELPVKAAISTQRVQGRDDTWTLVVAAGPGLTVKPSVSVLRFERGDERYEPPWTGGWSEREVFFAGDDGPSWLWERSARGETPDRVLLRVGWFPSPQTTGIQVDEVIKLPQDLADDVAAYRQHFRDIEGNDRESPTDLPEPLEAPVSVRLRPHSDWLAPGGSFNCRLTVSVDTEHPLIMFRLQDLSFHDDHGHDLMRRSTLWPHRASTVPSVWQILPWRGHLYDAWVAGPAPPGSNADHIAVKGTVIARTGVSSGPVRVDPSSWREGDRIEVADGLFARVVYRLDPARDGEHERLVLRFEGRVWLLRRLRSWLHADDGDILLDEVDRQPDGALANLVAQSDAVRVRIATPPQTGNLELEVWEKTQRLLHPFEASVAPWMPTATPGAGAD